MFFPVNAKEKIILAHRKLRQKELQYICTATSLTLLDLIKMMDALKNVLQLPWLFSILV